jgi:D-alanyl-D-alanine carboxypeptidase
MLKLPLTALCLVTVCISATAAQQVTAANADLQKLQKVLSVLPERNLRGLAQGTPEAFLGDLRKVLAADRHDLLRLVDKNHALPAGYAPQDLQSLIKNNQYAISRDNLALRKPAEAALKAMGEAARKDGITVLASSAYRSYDYQVTVYDRNVRLMGKAAADRESAQPGKSQHQLGTVVDFGAIDDAYAATPAGKWLFAHAGEYGWSLSFPQGYEEVTGYRWECWHYRYIGVEAAAFQEKWFSGIQQYMLEFIDAWSHAT